MADLEKDLRRQIDGQDPIISSDLVRKTHSFAHDVSHWELHGILVPSEPNPTPNRRGLGNRGFKTGELYAQFRGVDWIESDDSDGSFLSTVSSEEYDSMNVAAIFKSPASEADLPHRHELAMRDLFPEDWYGERVVYEITVKARILTREGKPIDLQPGAPRELASGE